MKFPDFSKASQILFVSTAYNTNNSVIIEKDGYILCNAFGMGTEGSIFVNGFRVAQGRELDSMYDHDLNLIPVKKGDIISIATTVYYNSGEGGGFVYWLPFKR